MRGLCFYTSQDVSRHSYMRRMSHRDYNPTFEEIILHIMLVVCYGYVEIWSRLYSFRDRDC